MYNRNFFPINVHSEISSQADGIDTKTKLGFVRILLAGLIFTTAWIGNRALSNTPFVLIGTILGIIAGIGISVFVWNKFIVDQRLEKFETTRGNKIFKFMKIALTSSHDGNKIGDVETFRYTTGEVAVMLSISIGNTTESGEAVTEEFFDRLFKMCHQSRIRIKPFTDKDEWENSTMHKKFLKRVAYSRDEKLKATLIAIDRHQSKIFAKSFVPRMSFIFLVDNVRLRVLTQVVTFVEQWRLENFNTSSMREMIWQPKVEVVKITTNFLGAKLIDMSPVADKSKRTSIEVLQRAKPHRNDLFFVDSRVARSLVDCDSKTFRVSKFAIERRGYNR